MSTSPVAAALSIIRAAKAGDVSAATAVDLHTAGLDRDELASVLRLIFPFLSELYAVNRAGVGLLDKQMDAEFAALVVQLEAGDH